jgi:hypothetical protein
VKFVTITNNKRKKNNAEFDVSTSNYYRTENKFVNSNNNNSNNNNNNNNKVKDNYDSRIKKSKFSLNSSSASTSFNTSMESFTHN